MSTVPSMGLSSSCIGAPTALHLGRGVAEELAPPPAPGPSAAAAVLRPLEASATALSAAPAAGTSWSAAAAVSLSASAGELVMTRAPRSPLGNSPLVCAASAGET